MTTKLEVADGDLRQVAVLKNEADGLVEATQSEGRPTFAGTARLGRGGCWGRGGVGRRVPLPGLRGGLPLAQPSSRAPATAEREASGSTLDRRSHRTIFERLGNSAGRARLRRAKRGSHDLDLRALVIVPGERPVGAAGDACVSRQVAARGYERSERSEERPKSASACSRSKYPTSRVTLPSRI